MRPALTLALSLSLLAPFTACTPARVTYDYDVRADFSRYHTFAWATPSDGSFTDHRVRAAIEKGLAAKGIVLAKENPPELLVTVTTGLQGQRVQSTGVGVGIGLRILPGVSVGLGTGTGRSRVQGVGSIQLELRDSRNSQLVWKAQAEDAFESGSSPEDSEADISDAVSRMLERFPPKAEAR
nr:DUF4136 domain-containing protein [uncultured Holophaga sp.]